MKKIIAVLLTFSVFILAFAGCSSNKDEDSTKSDIDYAAIVAEKSQKYADRKTPVAVIVMESGEAIVFELYPDIAGNTVNNFISLANKGFYDGLIFHRCIQDFMIQGGDPLGTGMGGADYNIVGEFSNNGINNSLSHKRGVVSMARKGSQTNPEAFYNTASSQFFICVADSDFLDGDYAAFGNVIEGMDVADKIVSQETDSSNKPLKDQVMKYVRVECYGISYAEPEIVE